MISDILSDAFHNIGDYQQQLPDCYSQDESTIRQVTTMMNALRVMYDLPPGDPAIQTLRQAINAVDLTGLINAAPATVRDLITATFRNRTTKTVQDEKPPSKPPLKNKSAK